GAGRRAARHAERPASFRAGDAAVAPSRAGDPPAGGEDGTGDPQPARADRGAALRADLSSLPQRGARILHARDAKALCAAAVADGHLLRENRQAEAGGDRASGSAAAFSWASGANFALWRGSV